MAVAVPAGTLVVSATKGIEADTLALMSQVFEECWPHVRYAALSGPSFAAEVTQGQPTAVVAAARDEATAQAAQQVFEGRRLGALRVRPLGYLGQLVRVAKEDERARGTPNGAHGRER